uniref:Velvet domain-containing protein n=1 Tax=Haemonchus contortus TaxID=6289 RepID=A0A7I4YZL5_HAECO|nr:unnamed protein product [Haemonchus contortus]
MAVSSADELSSPFLTRMLGKLQVLSTNLKCTKQPNGRYLYEYSVQVHPEQEDKDLAGLLQPNSNMDLSTSESSYGSSYSTDRRNQNTAPTTSSSVNPSYHSEYDCKYMVNVRFVLFHRNMNGRGQSTTTAEFSSQVTLRTVIEHFRLETSFNNRGMFAPRLAYSVGRNYRTTYPLTDADLDRPLSDFLKDNDDVNSLTILADIC